MKISNMEQQTLFQSDRSKCVNLKQGLIILPFDFVLIPLSAAWQIH